MNAGGRTLYQSPRGDRWLLTRRLDDRSLCVFHIAGRRSGGFVVTYDLEAFLIRDRRTPQGQVLLKLLGMPATECAVVTPEERLACAALLARLSMARPICQSLPAAALLPE